MSNKIPIDDLFREGLFDGKEQLNLGAWANMERMLNGQNPYAGVEQEKKRKRRILPFFAIFILTSATLTASLLWLNKKDPIAQEIAQPMPLTPNKQIVADNSDNPNVNNSITHASSLKENSNTSNFDAHAKASVQNSQALENISNLPNKKSRNTQDHNKIAAGTNNHEVSEAINKDLKVQSGIGKEDGKMKDDSNLKLAAAEVELKDLNANNGRAGKRKAVADVMEKIVTKEIVSKNRDGSISNITYDTIDRSMIQIEKKASELDLAAASTPKGKNYKYHPRYLVEEANAENPIVLNSGMMSQSKLENNTLQIAKQMDEKPKASRKEEKTSVIAAIGTFAGLALTKIGEAGSDFFSMFRVLDPGLSLGVNAALFNTKHNYGGFHAGITNHTAISETFSIFTELKFFIRNNSGFTINDIKTQLLNKNVDTSIPGQTTYNYQVDSLTKKYNFKSFMSLELPIMLNARFNNLSVYGGPNFVYNLKLKINEIDKKYVMDRADVVSNGTNYNYPAEKGMIYTRDDFGARFGIGYAVGVSYNFNPKIYLDLRLSKIMWDNTKTNSQREISNGVMKVPFTQLSLGYKFLNK